ncbi:hypothetical protein EON64_07380 [archaeon]|nr:MAG: hypothetical protein EON64_07380 [archaeon]
MCPTPLPHRVLIAERDVRYLVQAYVTCDLRAVLADSAAEGHGSFGCLAWPGGIPVGQTNSFL